jgi:hypothetical protein
MAVLNYAYHAYTPITGLDEIFEQRRYARDYYREMTIHVNQCTVAYNEMTAQYDSRQLELQTQIDYHETQIKTLKGDVLQQRQRSRKGVKASPEVKAQVKVHVEQLKELQKQLKEQKALQKADTVLAAQIAGFSQAAHVQALAIYGRNPAAWTHKTSQKQALELACKATHNRPHIPPRGLSDWLTACARGLTVEKLCSMTDLNMGLQITEEKVSRYKRTKAFVHMRVASKNREPVWAVIPIAYHRDLPSDAIINSVHLHRRKQGLRTIWSVRFTVHTGLRDRVPANKDIIALHPGWRIRPDGSMRVAYLQTPEHAPPAQSASPWHHGHEDSRNSELILPAEELESHAYPDTLQSHIALMTNEWRAYLAEWVRQNRALLPSELLPPDAKCTRCDGSGVALPHGEPRHTKGTDDADSQALQEVERTLATEYNNVCKCRYNHAQRLRYVSHMKSSNQMWHLHRWWLQHRFAGDEQIMGALPEGIPSLERHKWVQRYCNRVFAAWAAQFKHLETWQTEHAAKWRNRRNDRYRTFIKQLSTQYGFIVIPKVKWAELMKVPDVLKDDKVATELHRRRSRMSSPATLLQYAKEVFRERCIEVPGEYMTMICQHCQALAAGDGLAQVRQCPECEREWDIDHNGCVNQLVRGIPVRDELLDIGSAEPAGKVRTRWQVRQDKKAQAAQGSQPDAQA